MNLSAIDRRITELEKQRSEQHKHSYKQILIDRINSIAARMERIAFTPEELEANRIRVEEFLSNYKGKGIN